MTDALFTPPTWPSGDDLVSGLIPTLAPSGSTGTPLIPRYTGPALRVGVRFAEAAVTINAPATVTGLDTYGLTMLVCALQLADYRINGGAELERLRAIERAARAVSDLARMTEGRDVDAPQTFATLRDALDGA